MTDDQIEELARGICLSRKFETGHGTCAAICMDRLGTRENCTHMSAVFKDFTNAIMPMVDRWTAEARREENEACAKLVLHRSATLQARAVDAKRTAVAIRDRLGEER